LKIHKFEESLACDKLSLTIASLLEQQYFNNSFKIENFELCAQKKYVLIILLIFVIISLTAQKLLKDSCQKSYHHCQIARSMLN